MYGEKSNDHSCNVLFSCRKNHRGLRSSRRRQLRRQTERRANRTSTHLLSVEKEGADDSHDVQPGMQTCGIDAAMAWPNRPASRSAQEASNEPVTDAVEDRDPDRRRTMIDAVPVLMFPRLNSINWIPVAPPRLGTEDGRTFVWDVRGSSVSAMRLRMRGDCQAERLLATRRSDALSLSYAMKASACMAALHALDTMDVVEHEAELSELQIERIADVPSSS